MWQIVPLNLLAWREQRAYQRLRWALLAISLQAIGIILSNQLSSSAVTAPVVPTTMKTIQLLNRQPPVSQQQTTLLTGLHMITQSLPTTLYLSSLSWQPMHWRLQGYSEHYAAIWQFHQQLQKTAVFSALIVKEIHFDQQQWQFTLQTDPHEGT